MTKRARNRAGCILLVIFALVLSVWVFSYLKIQLFDLPALEAQKQSIVGMISMTSAKDQLLGEDHYPIRKTDVCFWGYDTWTYKSSQTWSGIVHTFDQSFDSWIRRSFPIYLNKTGIFYNSRSGPFYVELEYGEAANTYIVRLFTNDQNDPHCGLD